MTEQNLNTESSNSTKLVLPAVFSDLLADHDYYCSDNSCYRLNFETNYKTFKDFYNEMGNADCDMNLVFRFDIKQKDTDITDSENPEYYMEIFMVHQRKGRFVPFYIENVYEEDFELLKEYLEKKYLKIQQIWNPFSFSK